MALSNQAQMAEYEETVWRASRGANRPAHARAEAGVEPAAGRDPGKRNQPFVYSAAKATEEPNLTECCAARQWKRSGGSGHNHVTA